MSVRLCRPVPLDRPLSVRTDGAAELDVGSVLLAWGLERDGRRSTTASALVGPHGAVAARARTVWFAAR